GLDVRVQQREERIFAIIAWGECACSLYTTREGRERLLAFIGGLAADRIQLLLYRDGELPGWENEAPTPVAWDALRLQGLAALPEGIVAEIQSRGPLSVP